MPIVVLAIVTFENKSVAQVVTGTVASVAVCTVLPLQVGVQFFVDDSHNNFCFIIFPLESVEEILAEDEFPRAELFPVEVRSTPRAMVYRKKSRLFIKSPRDIKNNEQITCFRKIFCYT